MNVSSAAPHAFARRLASMSVRADFCHVAIAASLARLTDVAAARYAAASCATVGVSAGVARFADGIGVTAASVGDGIGVMAASSEDRGGVAVETGVEAAGGLVGAAAGDPDE
jgi:hypothetical protein